MSYSATFTMHEIDDEVFRLVFGATRAELEQARHTALHSTCAGVFDWVDAA